MQQAFVCSLSSKAICNTFVPGSHALRTHCMLFFHITSAIALTLLLGLADFFDKLTKIVIAVASGSSNTQGAFDPICNYHDVCFETPMPGLSADTIFDGCNNDLYDGLKQMCAFAFPYPSVPPFSGNPNVAAIVTSNYLAIVAATKQNIQNCLSAAADVHFGVSR